MAVPYQVQNLTAQQADGNILLTWDAVSGAVTYDVEFSTDGGASWANPGNPTTNSLFLDQSYIILQGAKYIFKVGAVNASGAGPYSSQISVVPAPPSEMSLMELRLRAQQTADRVGSQFVTDPEWNAFIRLAMYELYDLLIGSYEDYFASAQVTLTTNGSQQYYPLPDGITNYPGNQLSTPSTIVANPTFTLSTSGSLVYEGDIYQNNGYQFTVTQNVLISEVLVYTNSIGTPQPSGTLTKVSGSGPQYLAYSNVSWTYLGGRAPAFYKMVGVDLAVNTSTVNPAWVTLKKFNFIDRNKYIYPNSTSTIYGVYNQAYRIMGQQIQFIPVPAGNQTIRLWYVPRLPALLQDSDLTTLGYSGWLRYPIVRAAKYALDKEEGTDTSKLDAELLYLKQRIQEMASNRDVGEPDTISETRRDGIYGGTGWGNGMGGGNAGW